MSPLAFPEFPRPWGTSREPSKAAQTGSAAPAPEPELYNFLGMAAVVQSEAMRRVVKLAERVGRSSAAVLITGESGTGKELVARAIHHYSLRCVRPWIDFSCAALPELLIESELFGYEKGAFSGAMTTK